MIAWTRLNSPTSSDIWAGHISFNGSVVNTPFQLSSGGYDTGPCVSSPLIGTQKTMVVFQRSYGTDHDIHAIVQDGLTPIADVDLSVLANNGHLFDDQRFANVDSDGQHFLVGYSENVAGGLDDVFVDDVYLSGNTLGINQTRVPLATSSVLEYGPRILSKYGSGEASRRYMLAWQKHTAPGNTDVDGALFDSVEGGPWAGYCFGDGTGTACPCGNHGASGRGCANSVNPNGALLAVSGILATGNDTAVLTASGTPGTVLCVFFQGTATSAGAVFGDGLRCTGGTVSRIGSKSAVAGSASYPGAGNAPLSTGVPSGGALRTYQAWYRNPANFCTPGTFNLTNGVRITWIH
jgi:hypothetical protein